MAAHRRFRELLSGQFVVAERPQPLPGDLRIGWGVALVILILGSSRGKRSSLQKLHFLAHLSRTEATRRQTREVFRGAKEASALPVRVEPWVNRALAFAAGEGHVAVRDGKAAVLTEHGQAVHAALLASDILEEERTFLADVGRRATEAAVERVMKMERL